MAGDFPAFGFMHEFHADLFRQVSSPPPVVSAAHQRHRQSGIDDGTQSAQNRVVSSRDPRPILVPEIEQVAIDDDRRRLDSCEVQPIEEGSLVVGWRGSEVNVGGEQYGFGIRHARR